MRQRRRLALPLGQVRVRLQKNRTTVPAIDLPFALTHIAATLEISQS